MALRSDHINSVIGDGSVFEGKIYIQGSLEINGKFEGEIKTEAQIVIGKTGKVRCCRPGCVFEFEVKTGRIGTCDRRART